MNIRFECTACGVTVQSAEVRPPAEVRCHACGAIKRFAETDAPSGGLGRCPACGGVHLFVQKQFPRRVGLAVVAMGALAFLVLMGYERIWLGFGTLMGVAAIDALIYAAAPLMTVCYHCQSEFRDTPTNPAHAAYDPKIAFYTAKKSAAALDAAKAPPDLSVERSSRGTREGSGGA